jgi:D-proline reductase (dithiol) PrdB
MCHQTVGLVQAEIERGGIATASITMLPEITRRIRPPRALAVSYRLGFPLGEANAPELQRAILKALLAIVQREDVPYVGDFEP